MRLASSISTFIVSSPFSASALCSSVFSGDEVEDEDRPSFSTGFDATFETRGFVSSEVLRPLLQLLAMWSLAPQAQHLRSPSGTCPN